MPLLDTNAPPQSLAIANSALLMALLDSLVAKGQLSKSEAQEIVRRAAELVRVRCHTAEGSRARDLLDGLWTRFCGS